MDCPEQTGLVRAIGRRINCAEIARPTEDVVRQFSEVPSANIDDTMQRIYGINSGIRPLNRHQLCGPARTVRVPSGDNLFVHLIMDELLPGDVLVIAGGGHERAIIGELMLRYLSTRRVAGVVVDGLVRDLEYIRYQCPIPVFARGASPDGPYKNGPGEIDFPVALGGIPVAAGDLIRGDDDGVVVIPQGDVTSVLIDVIEVVSREDELVAEITDEGRFDRPWAKAAAEALGVQHVKI